MAKSVLRRGDERLVQMLEERLQFHFCDRVTALCSITHSSYLHEHSEEIDLGITDNERLEFLGDAVVDLVIGQRLMQMFPKASEGTLSRMRSEIVDERGLSQVARRLGVGDFLRLGRGERRSGGNDRSSILADAMESIIAAVFLEGGLEAVVPLAERHFQFLLDRAGTENAEMDFKSLFQTWAQAHLKETPVYQVISEEGPIHDRVFVVQTLVGDKVMGQGRGRTKKEAAHKAAGAALQGCQDPMTALEVSSEPLVPQSVGKNSRSGTASLNLEPVPSMIGRRLSDPQRMRSLSKSEPSADLSSAALNADVSSEKKSGEDSGGDEDVFFDRKVRSRSFGEISKTSKKTSKKTSSKSSIKSLCKKLGWQKKIQKKVSPVGRFTKAPQGKNKAETNKAETPFGRQSQDKRKSPFRRGNRVRSP